MRKIYCPDRDRQVGSVILGTASLRYIAFGAGISMSSRWEDWRSRFSKNEQRISSQNHVVVVSPILNFQIFGFVVLDVLR